MHIKLVTPNGYKMYEAFEVEWFYHVGCDVVDRCEKEGDVFADETRPDNDNIYITFLGDGGHRKHVVSQYGVYLMNDNGKTIEKLN